MKNIVSTQKHENHIRTPYSVRLRSPLYPTLSRTNLFFSRCPASRKTNTKRTHCHWTWKDRVAPFTHDLIELSTQWAKLGLREPGPHATPPLGSWLCIHG
ncbi:hypothetical protein BDV28DRAFT_127864 [Aspergillus coremiiformis]|uniref:Uncharacterized protein n=1 Tax=Aspergillus coremiiformis TaxID=138285 RepID=A0A5N6ZH23_9EURO|nr:hypothetical protein BDV28DRAFT_127864 [Aspergillus coremiiformis]